MPARKKRSPNTAATTAIAAAEAPSPIPGTAWSNNNSACNRTWWWLNFLGQIDAAFEAASMIRMDKLAYWDKNASEDAQEVEAGGIADMLIKGFTQINGAKYEAGFNYASALLAITRTLRTPDKVVAELAAVNDELFRFWNEPAPAP